MMRIWSQWRALAGDLRRDYSILGALALAMIASCLIAARWGLPDGATAETTATWAVDTIAPLGPVNEAYHRFTRAGIDDVIYPLFHYVVLAGAYAPYIAGAVLTGKLQNPTADFPYGATNPPEFFTHLTVLAAFVSALMAAGLVLIVWLITRELFNDRRAARWAAALSALAPPLAYYGMTSNLDVPYLFWTLLALYLLMRAGATGRWRPYLICGICSGLAVATKDQAAGYLIALPLIIPYLVACNRRAERQPDAVWRAVLDRRTIVAGLGAILSFAMANNLLFGGYEGFLRHMNFADTFYATNVAAASNVDLVARQPALAGASVRLLVEMLGVPTLVLAAIGAMIAFRRRVSRAWLLWMPALTYYVSIIAPTIALSRYLLGIALLAIPFAGLAISVGLGQARAAARLSAVSLLLLALLWQAALLAHLHLTLWSDSRLAMAEWIRANVPAGSTIESATQARYLPRIGTHARYSIVGNSFDAISYSLVDDQLTAGQLAARNPDFVLVLEDSGVSGDPARLTEPNLRNYYRDLLAGRLGYVEVVRFETRHWLPYRQITAGTQPTSVLLRRAPDSAS